MKRNLLVLCLVFLSATLILPVPSVVSAEEVRQTTANGIQFEYLLNDKNEALIVSFSLAGFDGRILELPEKLENYSLVGFAYRDLNPFMTYGTSCQSIAIPNSITQMPSNPFACLGGIQSFAVANDHLVFESVDGVLYSKPDKRLVAYPKDRAGDTYQVLPGTEVVGAYAFSDTNNLQVTLPDSVTMIENNGMFVWQQSMLELPKGLKHIGSRAFTPMLINSITLPKGIDFIGDNPFARCPMLSQIILEGNKKYTVVKGVLYDKSEKRLISYPGGIYDSSYTTLKDTVAVGSYAFTQAKLEELKLTDKITVICDHAFSSNAISAFQLSKNIKSIGAYAFSDTKGLADFTFPGQVKFLEEGMFSSSAVNRVIVEEGVESIGAGGFRFCSNLSTVELPKTLFSIGDEAFMYCEKLSRLKIPGSVAFIGEDAFTDTPVTLEVFAGSYGEEYAKKTGVPYEVQPDSWGGTLEIEDPKQQDDFYTPELIEYEVNKEEIKITWIQTEKKKFTIPATIEGYPVRVLGRDGASNEGLFAGNMYCKELVIPEGVEKINDYCFSQDYILQKVNLPKSLKSIGAHAFATCYVTGLQLPATLTEIGEGAFESMYALSKLTIDKKNPVYTYQNGMLIDTRNQQLVSFPMMSKKGSLKVPDSIRSIAPYAFSGSRLTDIKLPDGLEEIGAYAFFSSALKSIVIPDGVTQIAEGTFTGGTPLAEVSLPAGLTSIKPSAFQACLLATVTLPAGLKEIGGNAFAYCEQLKTVEGISEVDFIDASAFYGCSTLVTQIP